MRFIALLLITLSLSASSLISQMIAHEGLSLMPYLDADGISIGYGTHLPLTEAEAHILLVHRLSIIKAKLSKYSWFTRLSHNRQHVNIDMSYNLGINGLLRFKTMIWCLKQPKPYYHAAANALKDSLWYRQVGSRGKKLYKLMWDGK